MSVRSPGDDGNGAVASSLTAEVGALVTWVASAGDLDLRTFERALLGRLFALGRLLVALFLASRRAALETPLRGPRWRVSRDLATVFGKVRYERLYVRGDEGHGYAPLDRALGIGADLVSANLLGLGVLLSTQMPYEHARAVLHLFVGYVPSAKTLQHAALGFGSLAERWLDQCAPVPEGDGDVLVMLFDSKGVPTATAEELRKRRGPRREAKKAASPRHRGRARRLYWAPTKRRRTGDLSKNARLCTVAVVYTLRREGRQLLGPVNKRVYVTFGPKELAFQWAQRHAARRGFGPESQATVQVVTDGDENLAVYTKRYFPQAIHTLDVFHALEYVWQAGLCLHDEGTDELRRWFRAARTQVFGGEVAQLLASLREALERLPRTGPGSKARRERLARAVAYLEPRIGMMRYKKRLEEDLEVGSGAVEGTINHLVGQRFDHGGMRWIRERAQALLQLRCIHHNGDWDAFLDWALPQLTQPTSERPVARILRSVPAPLPTLAEAA